MKLGVVTPILTMVPRTHAKWEGDNDFDGVPDTVHYGDNDTNPYARN